MATKDARPGGGEERTPTPPQTERSRESSSLALTAEYPSALGAAGVQDALEMVADEATPFPDRAALYTGLYRLQLAVNRVLRKVQPRIAWYMTQEKIERAGALRVVREASKVEWTANLAPAWSDPDIQAALRDLAKHPLDSVFVRHVPDHYEVDTQALAAAMVGELRERTPAGFDTETVQQRARDLYRTMKESRWRRELEASLKVKVSE